MLKAISIFIVSIFFFGCINARMAADRWFGTDLAGSPTYMPSYMVPNEYQDVDGDGVIDHRRVNDATWERIDHDQDK